MDCCSKIDFAHLRTSSKVSSSLGSNLVPKSNNFLPNFDPKSTSETDFIFWRRFSPQSLPKWGPKGSKNALSELRKSALGPPWRHQDGLLVSKTLSQAPKLLILTSYGPYLDPIFDFFKLFWHHFQTRFPLQSSTHNSYIEIPGSQLADQTSEHNLSIFVHHLVFMIREHASHFSVEVPAFKVPNR